MPSRKKLGLFIGLHVKVSESILCETVRNRVSNYVLLEFSYNALDLVRPSFSIFG
jgi:hypothetical protein